MGMSISSSQKVAIAAWQEGYNVRILAVPGAGKSRVMLEACREADGLCIILAYNRELCLETKEKIKKMNMDDWVICMTFHGLASYCVSPCHDDVTLATIIEDLDAKKQTPSRRLDRIDKILIDEAQDFRPLFLRLIKHVISASCLTQYMVVGDEHQMLYDYHEDDPADLIYIMQPEQFFQSDREWKTILLDETHRLTTPMVNVVNGMFSTTMKSAKPSTRDHSPVRIFTVNMWLVGKLLLMILQKLDCRSSCILVPKKKNNGPLRAAVNFLSSRGIRIYIHGIDGQDPRIRTNKLCFSTWHASKGTEKRVCIVMGMTQDASDQPNPAYVAMTRGMDELIVIQDAVNPNARLMETLSKVPDHHIEMDDATKHMLRHGWTPKKMETSTQLSTLICLDEWRPSGSGKWICDLAHLDTEEVHNIEDKDFVDEDTGVVVELNNCFEDVREIYRVACLVAAEHHECGSIRRVCDMNLPHRLDKDKQLIAIKNGSHTRFVSPSISDESLIDEDIRNDVKRLVHSKDIGISDCCLIACAGYAWNNYHHTLKQLKPFGWFDLDEVRAGMTRVLDVIFMENDVVFDARIHREWNGFDFHARCDVVCEACALLFFWESLDHSKVVTGTLTACIHPSRTCKIIDLRSGYFKQICVDETSAVKILKRVQNSRITTPDPAKHVEDEEGI